VQIPQIPVRKLYIAIGKRFLFQASNTLESPHLVSRYAL